MMAHKEASVTRGIATGSRLTAKYCWIVLVRMVCHRNIGMVTVLFLLLVSRLSPIFIFISYDHISQSCVV